MKEFEFENIKYYVGRTAKENWELLDNAKKDNPNYIWFHLNSFASPYVIMFSTLDNMNNDDINEYIHYGANLCKEYSKYKFLKDIKIMYTSIKNLSKTDKLGEVDITGKYNIIKI